MGREQALDGNTLGSHLLIDASQRAADHHNDVFPYPEELHSASQRLILGAP